MTYKTNVGNVILRSGIVAQFVLTLVKSFGPRLEKTSTRGYRGNSYFMLIGVGFSYRIWYSGVSYLYASFRGCRKES